MKAFIMAADALTPEYVFDTPELFPNIYKLIKNGASSAYSSYVQKGYAGSYTSEQNWASIYTGLSPKEHMIGAVKYSGDGVIYPQMSEFDNFQPFWQILNRNGITVGLWSADCCDDPVEIDGYVIASKYAPIFSPTENREAPREIHVCDKDRNMLNFLDRSPPPRLYPNTLKQLGYTFEQLKANPSLANNVANEKNFQAMIDNFNDELDFWFSAMKRAQKECPVDVMYLFTPTTDILAHFTLYSENNPVLIKAYQLLDKYIGDFVAEFNPEMTILMSDHGQQNFIDLVKCSDPITQKEAFAAHDQVLWMENGYIAFEAKNGGLLFTTHSLKGVFIACGKNIKNTKINEMRTVDIYPTLLEMFGVNIPSGRSGFVVDIFKSDIVNSGRLLEENKIKYKSVALIQTHEVSVTDIIVNELYIHKIFAKITIVGQKKYEEIFCNNPRVFDFVPIEEFDAKKYDEVYCGFFNKSSGEIDSLLLRVCLT